MRIAIMSDIHGNLEALRAALRDVQPRGVDRFVCLGDVASFGPYPRECLGVLAGIGDSLWVRGNHDRYLGSVPFRADALPEERPRGFVLSEEWTSGQLGPEHCALLGSWQPCVEIEADGSTLTFVHASMDSDERLVWPTDCDRLFPEALGTGGVRVYGHIHQQHVRVVGGTAYVNPGSVGFPFDHDRRASYALITTGAGEPLVEMFRVDYDLGATIRSLRQRRLPWLERIIPALEQAVGFFSPELEVAE